MSLWAPVKSGKCGRTGGRSSGAPPHCGTVKDTSPSSVLPSSGQRRGEERGEGNPRRPLPALALSKRHRREQDGGTVAALQTPPLKPRQEACNG